MDYVTLRPWICAIGTAAVLSTLWGVLVRQALTPKGERGWRGFLLGPSEGIIFMASLGGFGVIGAAWLGFKVASKWKSWSLMVEARKDTKNEVKAEHLDTQYHRFLVGTAGNIVIGLVSAGVVFALGGKAFT